MSIHAYAWAWAADAPSPGAKLVLVALADYADETSGEAFPSLATIARRTGLSRRGVQRGRDALIAAGLLLVEARKRGNGSDTSSVYRLALEPVQYPPERDETGGVTTTPPPCRDDTPGGVVTTPPDPSVEPSSDTAPQPPKGGRARDRELWNDQIVAWAAEHFPGIDPGYVRTAMSFLPPDVPPTVDNLRASRLGWTLQPELTPPPGADPSDEPS